MPDETPRTYWDAQERIGQVALSDRDVLLVAKLQHGDDQYVRLQLHRRTVVDGVPMTVPGTNGVMVPLAITRNVAELLCQAITSE